jgi:hypothetical protein
MNVEFERYIDQILLFVKMKKTKTHTIISGLMEGMQHCWKITLPLPLKKI